jgi:hypothetical protein
MIWGINAIQEHQNLEIIEYYGFSVNDVTIKSIIIRNNRSLAFFQSLFEDPSRPVLR